MNVKFRGSKTEQLLINAFAGESQARNRYTLFLLKENVITYRDMSSLTVTILTNFRNIINNFSFL